MNSLYCKYIYEQKRIARLYMQSKSDDAEKDATQKKNTPSESNSFVALAIEFNKRRANTLEHAALAPLVANINWIKMQCIRNPASACHPLCAPHSTSSWRAFALRAHAVSFVRIVINGAVGSLVTFCVFRSGN